jgi:hypothetical protein
VAKAAVQDADQPIAQRPQGLMVGGATSPQAVVVAAGTGEPVNAANAHRWQAVVSPRLPTARANTTWRLPEARVIGAVPA